MQWSSGERQHEGNFSETRIFSLHILEFVNKYSQNTYSDKDKVLFVNEGLIRKEAGKVMPNQHKH